jgi:hypothetical protein
MQIGLASVRVASTAEVERGRTPWADRMIEGDATPVQRRAVERALASYRDDVVQDLYDRGCRIQFTRNTEGGHFSAEDADHPLITIDARKPPEYLHGVLLHELAHAIDWDKGGFRSLRDPQLRKLHAAYLQRTAADVATYFVAQLEKCNEFIKARPEGYLNWGPNEIGVRYEPVRDGQRVVHLEGLPLGELSYPHEQHIHLPDGRTSLVSARDSSHATVTVPADYVPQLTWSAYAISKNDLAEYLAEGVSHYLVSPEKRAELEKLDPELCAYVRDMQVDCGQWTAPAEDSRLEPFVDTMQALQQQKLQDLHDYYRPLMMRS